MNLNTKTAKMNSIDSYYQRVPLKMMPVVFVVSYQSVDYCCKFKKKQMHLVKIVDRMRNHQALLTCLNYWHLSHCYCHFRQIAGDRASEVVAVNIRVVITQTHPFDLLCDKPDSLE